jgi:hypothetical protein
MELHTAIFDKFFLLPDFFRAEIKIKNSVLKKLTKQILKNFGKMINQIYYFEVKDLIYLFKNRNSFLLLIIIVKIRNLYETYLSKEKCF